MMKLSKEMLDHIFKHGVSDLANYPWQVYLTDVQAADFDGCGVPPGNKLATQKIRMSVDEENDRLVCDDGIRLGIKINRIAYIRSILVVVRFDRQNEVGRMIIEESEINRLIKIVTPSMHEVNFDNIDLSFPLSSLC